MKNATEAERREPDRRSLANRMVRVLPRFGRWASEIREFETPYGKFGYRQLEVLWLLRHKVFGSESTPSRLAEHFDVQPSVLTRVLAKLESAGLVERIPDLRDGRITRIAATEKGVCVSVYVENLLTQEMLDSLTELDDSQVAELRRCIALLDDLASNLRQQRKARTANGATSDEE